MIEDWTDSPVLVLLLAAGLEFTLGELPSRIHPVVGMGTLIRGGLRLEPQSPRAQLLFGALLTVAVVTVVVTAHHLVVSQLSGWLRVGWNTLVLGSTFSVAGLWKAGTEVMSALGTSLAHARRSLRNLCSRDASELTEEQVVGATVESLIENTCDAFVAPLLAFAVAGPAGALAYRAINTLDSMIGYRGRYEYTGKFAARLDDVVNYMPARLSTLALLISALLLGHSASRGLRTAFRDHGSTASPNAGWTMACAAGCLGVQLEKVGHYTLGDALVPLRRETIRDAQRLMAAVFAVASVTVLLTLTLMELRHA